MTFSSEVKDELIRVTPDVRHCKLAEILAILYFIGTVSLDETNEISLRITTEHSGLARKYFTLVKKTFNINTDVVISNSALIKHKHLYSVSIIDDTGAREVLKAVKLFKNQEPVDGLSLGSNSVLINSCCKKAFLRGAFLSAGSITDPEKRYHLEIVCNTMEDALFMKELMGDLSLYPKITTRKKSYVVYVKDSEAVNVLLKTAIQTVGNASTLESLKENILKLGKKNSADVIADQVIKLALN